LRFLGTEGDGSSNSGLRSQYKKGRGTFELYKDRVITAIRSLRGQFIRWPDAGERTVIAQRIKKDYKFQNCLGFVDGTLFPFSNQPATNDASDYHGRKSGYGLTSLIMCDDQRIIRYYVSGWPASAHDNRVFRNSDLFQRPAAYFDNNQYVLGDSAYQNMWFMVSAYKKPVRSQLSAENERFNTTLSKARVVSEHCIGILKARFPILRSIRMKLVEDTKEYNMRKILKMIETTIILHNFLMMENDHNEADDWPGALAADMETDDDNGTDNSSVTTVNNESSDIRRRQVQAELKRRR
jgi:hypothetical protein